jgi:hypothetical protein
MVKLNPSKHRNANGIDSNLPILKLAHLRREIEHKTTSKSPINAAVMTELLRAIFSFSSSVLSL